MTFMNYEAYPLQKNTISHEKSCENVFLEYFTFGTLHVKSCVFFPYNGDASNLNFLLHNQICGHRLLGKNTRCKVR